MCDIKTCLCVGRVPTHRLILGNYIKAVCRLTEELGGDTKLINTAFTKNLMLPLQVILARVLSHSAGRIKPSL